MTSPQQARLVVHLARLAAVALTILLLTVLTVTRSHAAFSATAPNTGSSFATDSVVLTDDDSDVALFSVSGMSPGTPVVQCITVTYSGTALPAPIRLHGTTTGTLDTYIDLTIEEGTGGGFGSCGGFVANSTIFNNTLETFSATHAGWATGLAVVTAASNPTVRTVRFTVEVQDNPAAHSDTATADFIFETQA